MVDAEKVPYGAMSLIFEGENFKGSALSDVDGNFSIKLPKGKFTIKTTEVNSLTFKAFIEISENGLNPVDFELLIELNKNWCTNCPEGKMPEAITMPSPLYPPTAKAVGAEGEVVVEITFDENGKVTSAKTISGHPLLRKVSETCALNWTFSPDETLPQRRGKLVFAFTGLAKQGSTIRFRKPNRLAVVAENPVVNY